MTARPAERERLICALDLPDAASARRQVRRLGKHVSFYKVGMQLFATSDGHRLVDWLLAQGKQVFADMKLFDIPRTVAAAVRGLRGRGIRFLSVHGGCGALDEAVAAADGDGMGILAVTVLTSMDEHSLRAAEPRGELGELVASRSRAAHAAGCAGVVCSALEAPRLKRELGDALLAVTPGIRAAGDALRGDQRRVVDIARAIANGSDYLVIGRPLLNASDPARAADAMQQAIGAALGAAGRADERARQARSAQAAALSAGWR